MGQRLKKNLLTVIAHPIDTTKPDMIYENVYDICHTYGPDRGIFYKTLRLLSETEGKHERDYIDLRKYTVEIAMQKEEESNG